MLEQQKIDRMALNDFMVHYDEQPFELIDGEILVMTPMKYKNNVIQKRIFAKFLAYEQSTRYGEVFSEMPFVLEDTTDWLKGSRVPGVMYYQASRLEQYRDETEDYEEKPMILVPDIVVEIISLTDAYSDIERKAELYLQDGAKIIWIVDPKRKTVKEYTPQNSDGRTKRADDVLSGGGVAEEFGLNIGEIFS